ncbi:MAG: hypothetical protein QOF52_3394, partial [Propionibacteriaceae bacterium]|nr:hypothetical protein [Propionibacteriaceae bacterium]
MNNFGDSRLQPEAARRQAEPV